MRLTVMGTGHLGLVHAACMAELGHEVLGMDSDESKVAAASRGEPWFHEPGLEEMLKKHLASGKLSFTSSLEEIARFSDIHFVCVPTPGKDDGSANLSYVRGAITSLAGHLTGKQLIVGKSTVPPGTTAMLQLVARSVNDNQEIEVAWNPEFLKEGEAVGDTLNPERLVFGVSTVKAQFQLRRVYAELIRWGTPVIAVTPETAELGKLAANAFLAAKISFFNGIAQLGKNTGADPVKAGRIAGLDGRIGAWGTQPGVGFGGGCLSKDVRMLKASAELHGLSSFPYLLGSVSEINRTQRMRAASLACHLLGGLKDKKIAILGLAFKPGTSDVRDSPALDIIAQLKRAGAIIASHDPEARVEDVGQTDSESAIKGADLVIHVTDWPMYKQIKPGDFTPAKIIDARYVLDGAKWEAFGWEFYTLD